MAADVAVRRTTPVRANWGRWVADCSTPWCTNAWMPQVGDPLWLCATCGLLTEVTWPQDPMAVEALLLMRPDPNTRNWEPPETLADLIIENARHGLFPPGMELAEGGEPSTTRLIEQFNGHVVGGLVYGPIERRRLGRADDPSITAPGEPRAYREIGA